MELSFTEIKVRTNAGSNFNSLSLATSLATEDGFFILK